MIGPIMCHAFRNSSSFLGDDLSGVWCMGSLDSSLTLHFSLDSDIIANHVFFQIEIIGAVPFSNMDGTPSKPRSVSATLRLDSSSDPSTLQDGLRSELSTVLFGMIFFEYLLK